MKQSRAGQGGAMAPYLTLALLLVAAIAPQAARADGYSKPPAGLSPTLSAEQLFSAAAHTAALHCSQAQLSPQAAQRLLTALAGVELPAAAQDCGCWLAELTLASTRRRTCISAATGRGWPAVAARAP